MIKELSSFYFPYFLIPDEHLKLGVLYFDKIYADLLPDDEVSAALQNLPKEGPLAKYVFGQVRAIEKALEAYEIQKASWETSGLLNSGIIVPSHYDTRIRSLPEKMRDKIFEGTDGILCRLPEETATWLMKNKLRVWQMAGTYNWLQEEAEAWRHHASDIHSWEERMAIEIEELFQDGQIPDETFQYRSQPKTEGFLAIKAALLKSLQNAGPSNCYLAAYLPFLLKGITPWMADTTAEKLLTHQLRHGNASPTRATKHNLAHASAIKSLRFALPSLSFRSYEEVLEARYLCRDALSGYRHYVTQIVRDLETQEDSVSTQELPQIIIQKLETELKDLEAQVRSTKQAFLRDATKRAAPILTTLGIQIYINSPLVGVIGATLGTTIAALISAYEAQIARKNLLYGKRAHGLSFMFRLQRILK